MVRLLVMYRPPLDVDEFERRYRDEHVALAERIPGKTRLTLGRAVAALGGSPAAYHRIAEIDFPDAEALTRAGESEEAQVAFRHAMEIGTGGVDTLIVEVERDA
jgi:uncharacterized protein (TIGR02118 family)